MSSSLRSSLLYVSFKNILLSNEYFVIRNYGEDKEMIGEILGDMENQQGRVSQVGGPTQTDFKFASECRAVHVKMDTRDIYGIGFGHSKYVWKAKKTFSLAPVSWLIESGVNWDTS